jgi:hypothetical protein
VEWRLILCLRQYGTVDTEILSKRPFYEERLHIDPEDGGSKYSINVGNTVHILKV